MSEHNGYATRDALFGQPLKRRLADVEVKGQKFRLQSLNDRELSHLNASVYGEDGDVDAAQAAMLNARWIVACCVDADGQPMFAESDVTQIQELDGGFVLALGAACREHVHDEEPAKN